MVLDFLCVLCASVVNLNCVCQSITTIFAFGNPLNVVALAVV